MKHKIVRFSPGRIILLSYLFVITVGTILLALPYSQRIDIPLIDLFFTSASCTCVTGTMTIPISYFTNFGRTVILCLIQLGGIGLLTLSLFFISLFFNLGMATQMLAGELFEFRWSRIKTFIITIVTTTFIFELLGTLFFYFHFSKILPKKTALFHSLFHSVSSFCNTGIILLEEGMTPFIDNIPFMLVTAFLIFTGSIGFIVWFEIANKIKASFTKANNKDKPMRTPFSLHTKIVLATTTSIIILGTTLTWVLEKTNTLQNSSTLHGLFLSFFNTISLRTTGFEVFDVTQLMPATLLVFIILIFIGGSPGSIAGGIKTTTFALFITTMVTIVRNRDEVELFGRRIPKDQVYRAITIIVLSVSWVFLTTFILLISEAGLTFIQVFFEVISTFSLCGLPTRLAMTFSTFGKTLLILTMLIGRIGTLTLVFAVWKQKKKQLYRYPEEQIIIG